MQILNNFYFRAFMLIFAGIINIYAFAPYNMVVCIILSLLVLLFILNGLPNNLGKWHALGYGLLYGYAFFNTQIYWIFYSIYVVIKSGLFISIVAIICFSLFLGSYLALAIFSYIKLKTKSELFNLILLFPSIWVFCEWLRGWIFGGFSWCDIGYTQVHTESLRGFFPLLGEYGVSWICVSLIGALYLIIHRLISHKISVRPKIHYRLTIIYIAGVLIIGHGLLSVRYTKAYGNPISVALIQGNIGVSSKWGESDSLTTYAQAIKTTKADIVMIPETGISEFEMNLPPGYLDSIESSAKMNGASLIIGLPVLIDKKYNYVNAAMLLTGHGRPYYAKNHLLPFGEYIPIKWLLGPLYKFVALPMVDFSAGGDSQKPLVASNQKLAFNICFENGFGSELIRAAANSTLMVNLSDMVWYGTTVAMNQHLQLSEARALENQRYFIQETNTSITAIITPDGKIQSQLPVFRRAILKDYVQGRIGITPYETFGNWPIISWCIFIFLGAIIYRYVAIPYFTGTYPKT